MLLRAVIKFIRNTKAFFPTKNMNEQALVRKTKYDGRCKKRKWEERRSDKLEDSSSPEKKERTQPVDRVKRRKYAVLLGYSGVDYLGMQRNPGTKTIEEDLFTALLKSNLITQDAFNQVQTIQFQRAARTDKGVSAARQVVSVKLPETVDVSAINDLLPEVVRVFGLERVTKGFNSKSHCDGRTYMYMLPTIAFAKRDEVVDRDVYRLSSESLSEINALLHSYVGTKNFHNFTSKKKPNDPSAKRYIMSFECETPFVNTGMEFAVLKVKGQSFMLHQIRKMVGLTLAIIKGYTTGDTFTKAFTNDKVNVPKAPGLGLVLDYVHYDRYNVRYGEDGVHEKLEWHELDESVKAFKEKYIYPTIVNTEVNKNCMLHWIEKLERHNYDVTDEDDRNDENNDSSDEETSVEELKECGNDLNRTKSDS